MRSIRWMRDILIIVLMILFISGSICAGDDSKYVTWYEIPIQYKYISLKVITKCLGRVLKIGYKYCAIDEQKVIFENFKENIKKEIITSSPKDWPLLEYEYELEEELGNLGKEIIKHFGPSKDVFEYEMEDIIFYENKNGEIFVEIHYYRGGNCAQCFYDELYNSRGELIATDKQRIYLDSRTKKFLQVIKTYEKVKQKLAIRPVKEIYLSGEILRKGGKL